MTPVADDPEGAAAPGAGHRASDAAREPAASRPGERPDVSDPAGADPVRGSLPEGRAQDVQREVSGRALVAILLSSVALITLLALYLVLSGR